MPFSIVTQDGITIDNIPDDIAPDSDVLKQRVASIRAERDAGAAQAAPQVNEDIPIIDPNQAPAPTAQVAETSLGEDVLAGVAEFAASINRTIPETIDFLGTDLLNAGLRVSGAGVQIPSLTGALEFTGIRGGFMEPGTARDVVRAAGTTVAAAGGLAPVARNVATVAGAGAELLGIGASKAVAPLVTGAKVATEAVTSALPGQAAKRAEAKLPLLRESGDTAAAGFKLDAAGKVVPDPVQKAAIKQGLDEGFVAQVKASTPLNRSKMEKMVDIVEKGKANTRFAATNRPLDVVGGSILDRIKVVKSANRAAGRRLDFVAKGLKGDVDFSPAVDQFQESLSSMGIQFDPTKGAKINFKGSDLEDQAGPQKVIQSVVNRMLREGANTPQEVHKLKRFIDSIVTFGKTERGLSGEAERVLKGLRANLDDILDTQFPAYNKVNTQYAETIGALDAIQDVAGRKMDFSGPNANKALGTLSRRLLSNAASRVPLIDALEQLDVTAKKFISSDATDIVPFKNVEARSGLTAKDLDDDLIGQVQFVDELEKIFGASAATSLQGDVAKGVADAARRGITEVAADVAVGAVEKARGINEDNAFKAIKDLLKAT